MFNITPQPMIRTIVKRFTNLEVIIASCLLLLPLVLIVVTGELRDSISDYAYSKANNLFVVLLSLSGVMFFYNGFVKDKWYNIVLGFSLIGVALTPHLEYAVLHYIFAGVFFLGSIFVMVFYSSQKQRLYKLCAGVLIVATLLGVYVFGWYSLFIAEWIGIIPISIHFIGEALGKID